MKKALKRHGSPAAIVTDGLKSYRAAMRDLGNEEKQEAGRHANNRAENSHLPFRRRERAMLRLRRLKTLQRFAAVHAHARSAAGHRVGSAPVASWSCARLRPLCVGTSRGLR